MKRKKKAKKKNFNFNLVVLLIIVFLLIVSGIFAYSYLKEDFRVRLSKSVLFSGNDSVKVETRDIENVNSRLSG